MNDSHEHCTEVMKLCLCSYDPEKTPNTTVIMHVLYTEQLIANINDLINSSIPNFKLAPCFCPNH